MLVTCYAPLPPASLTTIPPELLLRIIAFLPSTSALLPLTQTSSGLRHFCALHASRICNAQILDRFPREAALLRSQIRDGWLVPTHGSVRREEALFAQKRRRGGAAWGGAAPSGLQPGIDALVADDGDGGCVEETGLRFGLSSPSPLYLGFLEEYSRDIRIRGELAGFLTKSPEDGDRSGNSSRGEREFAWQISTYSVRPFLTKLDALVVDGGGDGIDFDAASPTTISPAKTRSSFGRTFLARTGLGRIYLFGARGQTQGKVGMYGELPEQPREKTGPRTRGHRGLGRDATSAVLLWNIEMGGVQGLAPSSPISVSMGAPLLGERKKQQNKNLMKDIQQQARMVETRVRLGLVASSERMMSFVRRGCFGKQRGFAMLA